MSTWEEVFSVWAQAPAKTEQERYENAEQSIRNAIRANDKLKSRDIKVFVQGSYRNNTNVKQDSDVDIGILCNDVFYSQLPDGTKDEDFGIIQASYDYTTFKSEVESALIDYFGKTSVSRGSKVFNVKENSYHVEADVAPFFEHRRYSANNSYISGVELKPDNGGRVINWPEQHYSNGVSKNNDTSRRFKALIRITKSLCNYMAEQGIVVAKSTPSFLMECLLWNVPNNNFGNDTYKNDVQSCLAFLFNNTISDDKCSEWGEVSELKYLFKGSQKGRENKHIILFRQRGISWDLNKYMKNLNYKNFIWIVLVISGFVWWIIAKMEGINLSDLWTLLKQIPNVAFVNVLLFGVFVKWGWKCKVFQGWLVPFPNLNGTWVGTIQTTWVDPKTNKSPDAIPVLLTIKQNFLSLSCVMRTAEMSSFSYAEDFRIDNEKQIKQIVYSYTSKPLISLAERSSAHDGTIIFDITGNPANKLYGQYWTSRKTTGVINLSFKERKLLDQLPSVFPPQK